MKTFADKAIEYFLNIKVPKLPKGISVYNPYSQKEVKEIVKSFYKKYYDDNAERTFVVGINPGRFGGGLTGIGFTDPLALREYCGIENYLGNTRELSSKFIYAMIDKVGGVKAFFSKYYLTAMFPLALIKENKNFNYYDDKILAETLYLNMKNSLQSQIKFGSDKRKCICIGKKNADYLNMINSELKYFEKIEVVNHPRWIMQYRLKSIDKYFEEYRKALTV